LLSKIAEQHFKNGVEFYRAGEFAGARVEFQTAYDLSKLPTLLHNLSMAAQLEGKFDDAIAFEERFLKAAASASMDTPNPASHGHLKTGQSGAGKDRA
jgi:Flp pilus assembly protein TadD